MIKLPFISIVIPIYNAASYLQQCLDSIKNQSFTDFEVIMVNDGSTDASKEICMNYVATDNRFRLINQINSGVSSARNTGIELSRGKWITFIDSDDWIDCDYFLNNCSKVELEQTDAICNLKICLDNDKCMQWSIPSTTDINSKLQGIINASLPTSMWCYFFKRESVGDLRVDTGIHHYEDLDFLIRYIINDKKILFNAGNSSLYHYRQGSITHRKFSLKTISGFKVIDKCVKLGLDGFLLNDLFSKMLISISLIAARDETYKNEYDDVIMNRANEYRKSSYYKGTSFKCRLIIWLLSLNPKTYYLFYRCAHLKFN